MGFIAPAPIGAGRLMIGDPNERAGDVSHNSRRDTFGCRRDNNALGV